MYKCNVSIRVGVFLLVEYIKLKFRFVLLEFVSWKYGDVDE